MNAPIVSIIVAVRRVWCEFEAFHGTESEGDYTLIEVATTEGALMFEAYVDGHLTAAEVHEATSDLAAGRSAAIEWVDLNVSAAA